MAQVIGIRGRLLDEPPGTGGLTLLVLGGARDDEGLRSAHGDGSREHAHRYPDRREAVEQLRPVLRHPHTAVRRGLVRTSGYSWNARIVAGPATPSRPSPAHFWKPVTANKVSGPHGCRRRRPAGS